MNTYKNYRCGLIAIVGKPNVGKSTFINAVLDHKVSIVTAKPQTTRHRILGVLTKKNYQIIFIDTPGLHKKSNKTMNRMMNRAAASALNDADLIIFVSDALKWTDEDDDVIARLASNNIPTISLINKIDQIRPKEKLLEVITLMSKRYNFEEIIPASAKKKDNIDLVLNFIPKFLPISPPLFPEDMKTDKSEEFFISETIREKLTLMLHQELPYGLTVQIENLLKESTKITINAVIWVERDSQKKITIGKNGGVLKRAGRQARLELSDRFKKPVHLNLWVKVKSNWADNEIDLNNLGYEV
tara:strand:- start:936 stop:1835 length:900 start_codon:yes stop_codon:yes gene_type:complete